MKGGVEMKAKLLVLALVLLLTVPFFALTNATGTPAPYRAIVVFDGSVNEPARNELLAKFGAVKIKDLTLIDGKAVILPNKAAAAKLAQAKGVKYVDEDKVVTVNGPVQPAQVLPWGVDRIDAELVWPTTTADPVKVAVLDTGISLKHPDLAANIKGGINTINPKKSANDDNGHGSHVAGTIAAANNSIGVVGVGPSIDLYAVKVLNAAGSGYFSDVIEGLQWAVANGMQVANMSFGASSGTQSLHDAIIAAYSAGITLVAAAGNSGNSNPVGYPAAYPEVIAVTATNSSDQVASFSSTGPEVDLTAPGVSIFSTYKRDTYTTLSGTSMAAPHVTGAAALVISAKGLTDPAAIKARLESTADNLGYPATYQGAGLVDADEAALAP